MIEHERAGFVTMGFGGTLFSAPSMYSNTLKADLLSGTFVLAQHSNTRSATAPSTTIDDTTTSAQKPWQFGQSNDCCKKCLRWLHLQDEWNNHQSQYLQVHHGITAGRSSWFLVTKSSELQSFAKYHQSSTDTTKVRSVPISDIVNLSFFIALLLDPCELFCTFQGMTVAFVVRFRLDSQSMFREIPAG
jgi:hypothetical protein